MVELIQLLDAAVGTWVLGFRGELLSVFFLWVTTLGNVSIAGAVLVVACLLFVLNHRREPVTALVVSFVGTLISVSLLKAWVARARPSEFIPLYSEQFSSFPSAHAAFAVALYALIAYMLYHSLPRGGHRTFVVWAGAVLVLLIGVSRLYLGVHYLSDVLGGYIVGLFWFSLALYYLNARGGRWTRERERV